MSLLACNSLSPGASCFLRNYLFPFYDSAMKAPFLLTSFLPPLQTRTTLYYIYIPFNCNMCYYNPPFFLFTF